MIPNNFNDYLELLETFIMEERHKNMFTQFESNRRETVYKLVDVSKHCFRLVEDPPL